MRPDAGQEELEWPLAARQLCLSGRSVIGASAAIDRRPGGLHAARMLRPAAMAWQHPRALRRQGVVRWMSGVHGPLVSAAGS